MKRRILSIITALALCLSLCPTWALAAEADPSLCKHHPEHTEDCGYTAPTEGHDCGHEHTENCYTTDEAGGKVLDCHHSHDSECGYVQADPGTPCGYECRICPIEDLIAALPEQVTEDNADDVRAQLDHILDLYRELDEGEQEEINLSRIYALQGALDAANDPDMIEGEVSAAYQKAVLNGSEVTYTTETAASCTLVESTTTAWTDGGWYVVNSTVTISEPITVTGAVNLILADGCTLNAEKGIVVETGNSLTIYAQSVGTGTLNATGTDSAGIGGAGRTYYGVDGGSSGAITIHGGNITATSENGAGIGGGAPWSGANGGSGSNITIYGGRVTAQSTGTMGGAGIGGGGGNNGGTGSNIQIYGGTIKATGSSLGAGVGGGGAGTGGTSGAGTNITVSGGTVTAIGGKYAAGIGGGGGYYYSNNYGSGGCTGGTGSVTITGGIVDAKGGAGNSSGNYAGDPIGNGGNAGDTAATVSKTNAIVFENGAGTVCGDVTLDRSYNVPAGYTLNIPAGASLSGSGTLSGGSAFTTENLTADMISVPTGLYYTGKDRTEDITTELSSELTKGITICGQTFTVSGWTLAVEKAADSDLTYTATYINNNDGTKTFTKTITLLKSGTEFEDGIKTYNGETQTDTFTAGDTITVKAAPTPTGAAPTNSAMFAASFTPPTTGQMAVFVSDTQVSAPVGVGADGTYTMEVSAADVLLAAGGPGTGITLTAKFVENNNMADGTGTATVNITAAAKAERDGTLLGYYGESGLVAALANSGNEGAVFTLLDNMEREIDLKINISCTLDLNGKTIRSKGEYVPTLSTYYGTAVTIRGEGTVISEQGYGFSVGGTTTLEGGTFISGAANCGGVYVQAGKLIVTGEAVVIENTGGGTGLGVGYNAEAQLSGGTYSSIWVDSPHTLAGLLNQEGASRVAYYKDNATLVTEGLDGKELGGTVTVKACTHAYQYAHTTGTTTHSQTCPACGDAKASEKCDFSNGPCPCGAVLAVTQPADLNLTYNGTAQEPGVTVTVDGTTTLTKDTDYSVAYENNVEAGEDTAKVTVTGKTFTGTATLNFSISKATPTITWSSATQELTFTGQQAAITAPTVTLVNNESFGGTIHYSYTGTTSGTGLPQNAGTYTIKASIAAQDNYTAADSSEMTLTIKQARVTITWDSTTQAVTYTGKTAEITAPTITAEGGVAVSVTPTYSYHQEEGEPGYRDGLPTNAGTYSIVASIKESGNLTAAQADMMLTINKAPLTITGATVASKPYDGTDTAIVSGVTFTGLVNGETLALGTDYTATGEFDSVSAGTGKSVTVTVALTSDKAKNYSLAQNTTTATGTINRASSSITTAPTASGITYGQALSGSTLTGGEGSVAGAFSWTDGTVKPNAGTAQYEVTFTPANPNYNTATVNVSVTVTKATPTLTAPTAGAIQYGQKLSDSTLTGGTATNPNGNAAVAGSWSWANGNTQPTATGTFPVAFVPGDTANYNTPGNVDASVTVNPAEPKITLTVPAYQVANGVVEVKYTAANPHDATLNNLPAVTLTYKVGSGAEQPITDGKFTIPGGTAVDTVITVTASTATVDGKYTAATKTATVTVTDKIPVEISGVGVTGRAYNGKAINHTGTPVIKTLDGKTVTDATVTYTWSSGGDTGPINAGNYTLTISVDGEKYIGSTTVDFTIEKATVTITATNKSAVVGSAQPELTYTVSGLADGETLATVPTLTCTPDMNTVGSYPITASGAAVPNTGNYNTTITYVDGTLSVTAKPSTGGGGYVPSNPGGSTLPVTTTGQGSTTTTTTTTATPTASVGNGTATTTINTAMGQEIVRQATANKSENVVIAPSVTGNVTKAEVSIPASTVGQIGSQTSASLTVSTPVADVTIPNGGLGSLSSAGGTVTVTAEQVGSSVELTVTAGGRTIQNVPGGVTLTVPAANTTPGTVAVLVHPDGTREVVRKSVADNGAVTIPLDGSAKLEIVDNSRQFADVPATSWAADAVAFASAHELFGGTGANQFSPDLPMSRGMLAVVLHNLENNPAQALTGAFADVDNSQWYAEGVAWAEAQGIIGGYGNGWFGPNDNITREQLAVMLWRYSGSPAATDRELHFADAHRASDWALDALRWATENGIINGKGGGILDPTGQATRAEAAQMLKNFMEDR